MTPPSKTAIREALVQQHRQQAVQLMQQDKLAAALIQWKILHALVPEQDEVVQQITVTQELIQQRVKMYLQRGQRDMKQGQSHRAKWAFLAALALDPGQKLAHRHLRRMEHVRMKQALQQKLSQSVLIEVGSSSKE